MREVWLVPQLRQGLLPEHAGCIGPIVYEARVTSSVIEALQAAGAKVEPLAASYRITLGNTMPDGIVACLLDNPPHLGLRLRTEPDYPGELDDYLRQVDFTPCPVCRAPVVRYEAGFVPGYRVCAKPPHHHSLAKLYEATGCHRCA